MDKILVALVPVIHTSYIDLFKKYPNELYVLGEDVLKDWEKNVNLHRDLRRLDQEEIAKLIRGSDLVKMVKVLDKQGVESLKGREIVMPDEDVSHWFAETFLPNEKVEFENVFLRWNRPVSTQELEVSPDRVITEEEVHREFIQKAMEISKKSANWWRQIGSVVVKDGKIIGEAYNKTVPTQNNNAVFGDLRMCFDAGEHHNLCAEIHSEASIVGQSAKNGVSLDGADLYVTTFPCPTCAKLVAEAGIKRVYYKDGYSLSDAEDVLKNKEVEIILVK